MRKWLFIPFLISCLVTANVALAQSDSNQNYSSKPKTPLKDKLFLGGNFGLGFGDITYINISPQVGIHVSDRFSFGAGLIYQYLRNNRPPAPLSPFDQTTIGGDVFGRYSLIDNVFIGTEFQVLSTKIPYIDNTSLYPEITKVHYTIPIWFVGGGIRQPVGSNSYFLISGMYDLIQDVNSPYQPSNFIISAGFSIGL